MKLSIITINYNNRDGLNRTIESVVAQTFRDFEWIVIDGGSTDGSRELIEQYASHFAYWVSEPDKGIYNAMNKGIKVAKGAYLQFLNSGDWLCDETALERCFSYGFTADVAYGNLYFAQDGKEVGKCYQPKHLTFRVLLESTILHSASFIKRVVLANELYDENLKIGSDWKFFLNQALKNRTFEYIDEFVTFFDKTGISATNKELDRKEREMVTKELVSPLIIYDYQTLDEMERALNETRVRQVMEYSAKSILYRKMISVPLLLIGVVDKVIGRIRNAW